YAGWYCVGCEAFKTEAELVDGKCPDHGTAPEWLEEKNWFFRLSAYQDRLLQLYDERPDFVLPSYRYNEARSFIAGGLRDFSISRATQTWGVPIPWDPDQVAYVWADALVNYRSALSYAPGEQLEQFWPAVHLLAKDILRFHCVYWPALLLSAGEQPPKLLSALDRFDISLALEEIWKVVRRLNRYVEESAPWQLAKDEARAAELTGVLYNLADGLTAIAVALAPYVPESAPRILEALGQPTDDLSLERLRRGTAVAAAGIEPAPPLFPRVELPA